MEITNKLLEDLNEFRNSIIILIDDLENNNVIYLIDELKQNYKDFCLELMANNISEEHIKDICKKISMNCFLIYQKMSGR